MSLTYRIEKKKIVRNQLHLVKYFKSLLSEIEELAKDSEMLRRFVLEKTDQEEA